MSVLFNISTFYQLITGSSKTWIRETDKKGPIAVVMLDPSFLGTKLKTCQLLVSDILYYILARLPKSLASVQMVSLST